MLSLIYKIIYMFILTVNFSVVVYNISPTELGKKSIGIYTIVNYIVICLLYIKSYDDLILIFVIISTSYYIYSKYKRIYYSIIITALTVIIYAVSDLIIGSIEIVVFNVNRIEIINNPRLYFYTLVFILINSFIVSRLINRLALKYNEFNLYLKRHVKYIYLLVSYLIVVVVFIVIFVSIYKEHSVLGNPIVLLYSIFVMYSFVLIIVLFLTSHKNMKKELEKEYKDKEDARFKEYTAGLETLTCELRKFRHDYLNILKTLGGYIELGNIEELKKYYNDVVNESELVLNKQDKCFMLLQYIKIDPLKSLIASKIANAQSFKIKTHIEIFEDIDELSINVIDICRIIGIFLDNAIEAAVNSEEKFIELAIIKNEEDIIFLISNSCTKDTPPVYKLYQKNFSTKGSNRGIGLKTVREIISEKYPTNVILNTKISNLKFMQELIITNKV